MKNRLVADSLKNANGVPDSCAAIHGHIWVLTDVFQYTDTVCCPCCNTQAGIIKHISSALCCSPYISRSCVIISDHIEDLFSLTEFPLIFFCFTHSITCARAIWDLDYRIMVWLKIFVIIPIHGILNNLVIQLQIQDSAQVVSHLSSSLILVRLRLL